MGSRGNLSSRRREPTTDDNLLAFGAVARSDRVEVGEIRERVNTAVEQQVLRGARGMHGPACLQKARGS